MSQANVVICVLILALAPQSRDVHAAVSNTAKFEYFYGGSINTDLVIGPRIHEIPEEIWAPYLHVKGTAVVRTSPSVEIRPGTGTGPNNPPIRDAAGIKVLAESWIRESDYYGINRYDTVETRAKGSFTEQITFTAPIPAYLPTIIVESYVSGRFFSDGPAVSLDDYATIFARMSGGPAGNRNRYVGVLSEFSGNLLDEDSLVPVITLGSQSGWKGEPKFGDDWFTGTLRLVLPITSEIQNTGIVDVELLFEAFSTLTALSGNTSIIDIQ